MDKILQGDALSTLKTLPSESIDCIITSPPYWGLRDYGMEGQIGLEKTPQSFVKSLTEVFEECRRVLKKDGTFWLNIGDSYCSFRDSKSEPDSLRGPSAGTKVPLSNNRNPSNLRSAGLKHKDLAGVPWRLAFALQEAGWYLRADIIWHKPNPMPESVTDRPTKAHEYIFLLTKSEKYFYDGEAIKEKSVYTDARAGLGNIRYQGKRTEGEYLSPGLRQKANGQQAFVKVTEDRNKRSVWSVTTKPFTDAHFATFPEDLIEPMVLAGCRRGGVILDPFMGAGTTAVVAKKLGRQYLGLELNPAYIKIAEDRIAHTPSPLF